MTHNNKQTDILSLCPEELEEFFASLGEPRYRAAQVFGALHKGIAPYEITTLSKALRDKLRFLCEYRLPTVSEKQVSALDGTVKYLFRLIDGECIESVFMRYRHGNTLCVSTQVGCRMGCAFCASTIGGKVRDLYASEILGQIIAAQKDLGERVSNIVMMGIGEPLDNLNNVVRFLRLVNDPKGLCIGYRHISLSTCGLADGIDTLAEYNLPITLSVSLHAASNEKRSALMPVNRKYNLESLLFACRNYFSKTGRRISFEYTLISGENDSDEDAKRLAALLKSYLGGEGVHINLITLNPVAERDKKQSTRAREFICILEKEGFGATVRRRLGSDIDAACGQLRRRDKDGKS